jgi:signal transduction histidine kinase
VEKIEETSRETINTMSDIVWSIAPNNDSFENVLNKMKQFGAQLTVPLGISFSFNADHSIKKLALDMMQRKNVYLLYKESVNNACKHAQATALVITLERNSGSLVMRIADNGRGFDADCEHPGHGIGNLKVRAADLNGKIDIRSETGAGTSVTLTIPL